jgi:plasmid stabilization system protein ParE
MSQQVRLTKAAELDLEDAADWYRQEAPPRGLAVSACDP